MIEPKVNDGARDRARLQKAIRFGHGHGPENTTATPGVVMVLRYLHLHLHLRQSPGTTVPFSHDVVPNLSYP